MFFKELSYQFSLLLITNMHHTLRIPYPLFLPTNPLKLSALKMLRDPISLKQLFN